MRKTIVNYGEKRFGNNVRRNTMAEKKFGRVALILLVYKMWPSGPFYGRYTFLSENQTCCI